MPRRILIAEDDTISRRLLEATLLKKAYELVITCDGKTALKELQKKNGPELAILDWMMPGLDGVDVCKQIREWKNDVYIYIILLTAKGRKEDVEMGLDAGADDYIIKPFHSRELYARVRVGMRLLDLQRDLEDHVAKLKDALSKVKQLQGLLPICAYCKNIRDDQNYWQRVENYIADHSDVKFSHGICPDCYQKFVAPELNINKKSDANR